MTQPIDLPAAAVASDFESFYRSRWAGAVRLGRLLTGSEAVAEELAQDVFLGMRGRWSTIATPDAYLRRSLVNRSHNHRRRAGRELSLAEPERVAGERTVGDHEVDELWALVQRLPHRYRDALVLRYYEDLSEADIAATLGCRPGTVKSLLHRGLAKLKEQLP
jgi:RNA polymerase sigma-70 factor (sigma-E family)